MIKTDRICRLGYFDRVTVDGFLVPMYRAEGIEIDKSLSLADNIESKSTQLQKRTARLRINIYGDSEFDIKDEQLLNMRFTRENKMGLERRRLNSKMDRYVVAYAEIIVVRDDGIESNYTAMMKELSGEDEISLMKTAYKYIDKGSRAVAIVDKVYVYKNFRYSGISTWIHNNIKDLILVYGATETDKAILIPGDFSGEAKIFMMKSKEYTEFLRKHYKNCGYRSLLGGCMVKEI